MHFRFSLTIKNNFIHDDIRYINFRSIKTLDAHFYYLSDFPQFLWVSYVCKTMVTGQNIWALPACFSCSLDSQ